MPLTLAKKTSSLTKVAEKNLGHREFFVGKRHAGIGKMNPILTKTLYASAFFVGLAFSGARCDQTHTSSQSAEPLQALSSGNTVGHNNQIVFLVNTEAVFTKTFEDRLKFVCLSLGLVPTPAALVKIAPSVLSSMVDEIIRRQWAIKMGIQVTEAEVMESLDKIESSNQMPKGHFKKMLADQNIPLETFLSKVYADSLWERYLMEKYGRSLVVTSQQKESLKQRLRAQQNAPQYRIAEIVVYKTGENGEQALKNIQQIQQILRQGAPFSAVAQQFSQSPSAAQGGARDWISCEDLEESACQAVETLPLGVLSDPIQTTSGYMLVVVLEKNDPQETPTLPTDEEIETRLKVQALERLSLLELTRLRERIPVEIRLAHTPQG